jgi:hypothetical protein
MTTAQRQGKRDQVLGPCLEDALKEQVRGAFAVASIWRVEPLLTTQCSQSSRCYSSACRLPKPLHSFPAFLFLVDLKLPHSRPVLTFELAVNLGRVEVYIPLSGSPPQSGIGISDMRTLFSSTFRSTNACLVQGRSYYVLML